MFFDELTARLDFVPHQDAEHFVGRAHITHATWMSVRLAGSKVVSRSSSAFISPRPLNRVTCRPFSARPPGSPAAAREDLPAWFPTPRGAACSGVLRPRCVPAESGLQIEPHFDQFGHARLMVRTSCNSVMCRCGSAGAAQLRCIHREFATCLGFLFFEELIQRCASRTSVRGR